LLAIGLLAGNIVFRHTPVSAQKDAAKKQIDEELYVGIRLGMMVPYFGKELPPGFVWADGKSKWPDSKWVPDHLRGKNVPDMSERVAGGAKNRSEVGEMYAGGKVTVPGAKIEGKSFQLPAASWERLKGEVDEGKHARPSPNAWMILFENFEGQFSDVKRNPLTGQVIRTYKYPYVEWQQATDSGWWHRANLRPLNVPIVKGDLTGGQDLPAKSIDLTQTGPYLKCQWIIRIQ